MKCLSSDTLSFGAADVAPVTMSGKSAVNTSGVIDRQERSLWSMTAHRTAEAAVLQHGPFALCSTGAAARGHNWGVQDTTHVGPAPAAPEGAAAPPLGYATAGADRDSTRAARRALAWAGSPDWQTVLAAVLVVGAWVVAMWLFDASPLRRTVGYIYGNETPEQLAYNLFAMRLFLCLATTTIVAGASLLLSRRGADLLWVGICFVLGLCSAVLWGGYLLAGHAAWMRVAKWPKLMSSVFVLLLLVALVRLLAGAMRHVGRRPPRA